MNTSILLTHKMRSKHKIIFNILMIVVYINVHIISPGKAVWFNIAGVKSIHVLC